MVGDSDEADGGDALCASSSSRRAAAATGRARPPVWRSVAAMAKRAHPAAVVAEVRQQGDDRGEQDRPAQGRSGGADGDRPQVRQPRSTPITPFEVDGRRYVVGGLPGSDWVRNAQANPDAVLVRGRTPRTGADGRAARRGGPAAAAAVPGAGAHRRRLHEERRPGHRTATPTSSRRSPAAARCSASTR